MANVLEQRIRALQDSDATVLTDMRRGIEKESLRVTTDGRIAQTPHPRALGSTLTHPHITTDYSEALLEFITPASTELAEPLAFLDQLHRFVYSNIGDGILWTHSMPCMIEDDLDVPIANYGSSNVGMMKHIYRRGLWHRYGRRMQAIAGIHYNVSFPEAFWQQHQQHENHGGDLQAFVSSRYFDLVRNFHRYSWLLVYLFGASPAMCACFLAGRKHQLLERSDHTLFRPFATSLRMSDLGYQNNAQSSLNVSFNNLDEYVRSLQYAIETAEPAYDNIGILRDGEYQQLNTNILQIENEYYSSIRPKRTSESGERPTLALKRRGVEYIEIRVMDLNPFEPVGIGLNDMRFLDMFATWCLLHDSPLMDMSDLHAAKQNLRQVVYNGRNTGIRLCRGGQQSTFRVWALDIIEQLAPIAELFDGIHATAAYSNTLQLQKEKILHPEQTPSAQVMEKMEARGQGFFAFAMNQSLAHRDHFRARPLDEATRTRFEAIAAESLREHDALELEPQIPFEEYLAAYFANP